MKKFKVFTQVVYKAEHLEKTLEKFVAECEGSIESVEVSHSNNMLIAFVTYIDKKVEVKKVTKKK